MIVARIIAGIGNGINTATAPIWQAETSKAKMRGMLVVAEMVFNIAGFSLSNWLTFGFSYVPGPVSWRFPIAFQLLFLFVLFATVPWLPESPRWLVAHGRVDEAEQIIADLEDMEKDHGCKPSLGRSRKPPESREKAQYHSKTSSVAGQGRKAVHVSSADYSWEPARNSNSQVPITKSSLSLSYSTNLC